MGVPHHLTCLLRKLNAGQEAPDRMDMEELTGSKLGKEYDKTILSPFLFNLNAEYITQNTRLDESQAGFKILGRNNNLRYEDDTTLIAEGEDELKSLLMRVKEMSELS